MLGIPQLSRILHWTEKMTTELKETMGRASWDPEKVKMEEDDESVISQASSQQVYYENDKDCAPGEGPYGSISVSEDEEKVNDDLGEKRNADPK